MVLIIRSWRGTGQLVFNIMRIFLHLTKYNNYKGRLLFGVLFNPSM